VEGVEREREEERRGRMAAFGYVVDCHWYLYMLCVVSAVQFCMHFWIRTRVECNSLECGKERMSEWGRLTMERFAFIFYVSPVDLTCFFLCNACHDLPHSETVIHISLTVTTNPRAKTESCVVSNSQYYQASAFTFVPVSEITGTTISFASLEVLASRAAIALFDQ
jgi:hypothetical protein